MVQPVPRRPTGGADRAQRGDQHAGAHRGQGVAHHGQQRVGVLGPTGHRHQPPGQLSGPLRQQPQRVGVHTGAQRLLQPARPPRHPQLVAHQPHQLALLGRGRQQQPPELGVGVHCGPAQHGERERGPGVPVGLVERVQVLGYAQPGPPVPEQVVDQPGERQLVQPQQDGPAQPPRQRQPHRRRGDQSGVAAEHHVQQPQQIGRRVHVPPEQFGPAVDQFRVREQPAKHQCPGLPHRDRPGQPAEVPVPDPVQQHGEVVAVLRRQRGGAGQQRGHRPVHGGVDVVGQFQHDRAPGQRRDARAARGRRGPQERVVLADPAVADRARRVVRAVPTPVAHQVRARRHRLHGVHRAAQHTRLPRFLQQEGEHPPHVQLGGVLGHAARKPPEQGHVRHVRPDQPVQCREQPGADTDQALDRQPGQVAAQPRPHQESPGEHVGLQRHHPAGDAGRAAPGHLDLALPTEQPRGHQPRPAQQHQRDRIGRRDLPSDHRTAERHATPLVSGRKKGRRAGALGFIPR